MSNANAENSSIANEQSFAISDIGDAQFGQNGIGIWIVPGNVRIRISNSFSPLVEKFSGAGTVDTQLTHGDQDEAKELFDRLCEAAGNPPAGELPEDRMTIFSVDCLNNGKLVSYQGLISDLPHDLGMSAIDFYQKVLKRYPNNADVRNIVRVEAMIADVQRQKSGFLVSMKFTNRGHYPVSIQTPDEWPTTWNRRLLVTGWNDKDEAVWRTNLSGMPVVNKAELSTWILDLGREKDTFVEVKPGQSVTFRIPVVPDGKVPKGTYRFAGSIVTTMMTGRGGREIENGSLNLSLVNLGTSASAHATFDTDYPSTPEEWKEYEARERAKRSSQLIEPGEPVPGAGYYRLVSDSGQRSRFVRRLSNGQTAEVHAGELDEHGKPMTGKIVFQWEADDTIPVDCAANTACPREGRWIPARIDSWISAQRKYEFLGRERFFIAGESMPEADPDADRNRGSYMRPAYWFWLGV